MATTTTIMCPEFISHLKQTSIVEEKQGLRKPSRCVAGCNQPLCDLLMLLLDVGTPAPVEAA